MTSVEDAGREVLGTPPTGAGMQGAAALHVDDSVLAQLVRGLADAVIIADREQRIVFWNDAAAALFGWSSAEALGQTLELIVPARLWERHATGYAEVMRTGRTQYHGRMLEVPSMHRDGRTFSIAFTVTLIGPPDHPTGIAAVLRDDTVNRQARVDARRAAPPTT